MQKEQKKTEQETQSPHVLDTDDWLEEADDDIDDITDNSIISIKKPVPVTPRPEAAPLTIVVPDYKLVEPLAEKQSKKALAENANAINQKIAEYDSQRENFENESKNYKAMTVAEKEAFKGRVASFANTVNLYCNLLIASPSLDRNLKTAVADCASRAQSLKTRYPSSSAAVQEDDSSISIAPLPVKSASFFSRYCCCFASKARASRTDLLPADVATSDDAVVYTSFN